MTAAVVILNWNGKELLERFLPSVLASVAPVPGARVVVADNCSTDGSQAYLKKNFPDVKTICLKKNYGFAEGYNRALSKLDDDIFVLLNSDVRTPDFWLDPLLEWMELHPDCGVCGPKLHQVDKNDYFEYAGAAGGYIDRNGFPFCRGRNFRFVQKDEGQYDVPAEVFWVSGAALVVRSSLYRSLGGLCRDFFAHMEEIDFCWRARLSGWKVCSVPRSVVYHLGGASLSQGSPFKLYLNCRNNLLMLSRNMPLTRAYDIALGFLEEMMDPEEGPDLFKALALMVRSDPNTANDIFELAASAGIKLTRGLIFKRMLMDGLLGGVYFLTGRWKSLSAVLRAHRDFRQMRQEMTQADISMILKQSFAENGQRTLRTIFTDDPLEENYSSSANFAVKGIWGRNVLWESIFRKEKMFDDIKDKLV